MKDQIKIYVSHSIRGKKGLEATKHNMRINNNKAIMFGRKLRQLFPSLYFYVPGDHDEFVIFAYEKKYLTEKQILDIDCSIIRRSHFVIVYSSDGYISRGMKIEIDFANKNRIPVVQISSINKANQDKINRQLLDFIR